MLILDYTQNILDKKSQELLDKLYEEEYVKRILVVYNSELNSFDKYPSVCYNENFCSNVISSIKEILSKPLKEKKFCDSHWVKIIGTHLNNIGFSLKHNGYFILIDAIIYVLSNKGVIKKLTEDVYSYLAIIIFISFEASTFEIELPTSELAPVISAVFLIYYSFF